MNKRLFRWLRLFLTARYTFGRLLMQPPYLRDGFGNVVSAWCEKCGGIVQIVRPGHFRCTHCEEETAGRER